MNTNCVNYIIRDNVQKKISELYIYIYEQLTEVVIRLFRRLRGGTIGTGATAVEVATEVIAEFIVEVVADAACFLV